MNHEERDKMFRVLILNTLVEKSGQPLTAELIGQLTTEILLRLNEVLVREDVNG